MSFNHSVSSYMKLLLIICSKSTKITSKQCSGAMLISLFFGWSFSKLFIRLKERSLEIFFESFYLTNEILMNAKPKKNPVLKNSWLRACSWFLSNIFKYLAISFVYLTNHLTNIRTNYKLSAFCLCKASTVPSK